QQIPRQAASTPPRAAQPRRPGRGARSAAGAALAGHPEDKIVVAHSARNRFGGLFTRVTRDTVMAQVEIQAGPYRFVSLLSREATDELGLEPGMLVIA